MKSLLHVLSFSCAISALLILGGCASGEVHRVAGGNPAAVGKGPKLPKPAAIYVGNIDMSTGEQRNIEPKDVTAIHDKLEKGMLERLPELAPTKKATGTETTGWLITAKVSVLNLGSAAARFWVGGGLGQAKEAFIFEVYDLAQSRTVPIHRFESYADSGSQSGIVAGMTDSDCSNGNTGRICREARDEIAKLFQE